MIYGAEKNHQQERRVDSNPDIPPGLYDILFNLSERIFGSGPRTLLRSVMVTAIHPRSGVSYLSSCWSTLIAEVYGDSLLVDGQVAFDLSRMGILPMRADCAPIKQNRLWVLGRAEAAGLTAQNTGDVSVGRVLKSLLTDIKYAVVDSPPLFTSKVAESLCSEVDGVILVVVPHQTDIKDIHEARIKLMAAGGHILGAIYNTAFDPAETGF